MYHRAPLSLLSHHPIGAVRFHLVVADSFQARAKAALQRDLDKLKARSQVQPEHPPIHAFVAQPIVDETQQSPEQPFLAQQPSAAPTAPMAPVPDMGGSMAPAPTPGQPDVKVKIESTPSAPQALMEPVAEDVKPVDQKSMPAATSQTFAPAAPEAMMDDVFGLDMSGGGNGGNAGEFNFTDMTFGLAPSNTESQDQGAQQPDIDMSAFGNDDLSSLDNMLAMDVSAPPPGPVGISSAPLPPAPAAEPAVDKASAVDLPNVQSTNSVDDLFDLDGDGSMDLSMDFGGSGDGSNFDNVFFADKFDESSDKFDDAFFHIP